MTNEQYIISESNLQYLISLLKDNNYKISFAESCTGGLAASTIISVPGASDVIDESYVTYSNEAKMKILNVTKESLEQYTAVSRQVAKEMVIGLYNTTDADVCVSFTGYAGKSPDPNVDDNTIYVGFLIGTNVFTIKVNGVTGLSRNAARNRAIDVAIQTIISLIE